MSPAGSKGPDAPPRLGRRRDWVLGSALLLGLLLTVSMTVGWGPLLAPWTSLSRGLLAGLFGLTALSYVLRAVRVQVYFGARLRGRFPSVLRLSVLHNAANNLLPMRSGELVFPWLMRRYFGHGLLEATATLLWIRLLDLHALGAVGILILSLRAPDGRWIWLGVGALWVAMLALVLALRAPLGAQPSSWLARLARQLMDSAPAGSATLVKLYLLTLLVWALKFAAFALLLGHFLPVEPWRLLTGVMGAELSSVLPFHGIAGSGSYELAVVAALAPLGVEPASALTGAVNLHLFLLGTTLLLGALALLLPGASAAQDVQGGRPAGDGVQRTGG